MSFSTEPTAKTNPASDNQTNGYTPLDPLAKAMGKGSGHKELPSSAATSGSRLSTYAIGGVFLIAILGVAGWYFFLRPAPARADVLLHTVKREPLVVSVTEKGTLESADNRDIVCRVRAGSKGFASTINWVIDDGSLVKPGQLLMILDDSALKDQEADQQIKVDAALANKVKAEKDYEIAVKQNEIAVATAKTALILAEIELEKFTGLEYDPTRATLAALGGGMAALTEAGAYRQMLDDLTGKVRLAEADVEQYRERAAWAERMVKLSYMSSAQAQSEKTKLDSAVENLRSLQAQRTQHLTYIRKQQLTDLTSKRNNARLTYESAILEAEGNLAKAHAEKQRAISEYNQQDEKLRDIIQQRAECKITAPDTIEPGSMVVYYKPESSRWRNTSEGMIEQGAQVKEGQKLLRIPNLRRMQVNTKVHEAMVARIRGDVRVPTHIVDGFQTMMLFNTDPFSRVVGQRQEVIDRIRERFRNAEYKKISEGQKATIRVDALPDRVFEGHVRIVAQVASQADSWISDVKLYQTVVMIDYEVMSDGRREPVGGEQLKPDMTAEVTITVDTAKEPVLSVPVQAIVGGTDLGTKREVFVKTPTGFERRPVTLGIYNDKVVEIRDGLKEGDEVVINPKVLLGPDDKTRTRDGDTKGGENKGGKGGDNPKGDGNGYGTPPGSKGEGPSTGGTKAGGTKTGNKNKRPASSGPPPSP